MATMLPPDTSSRNPVKAHPLLLALSALTISALPLHSMAKPPGGLPPGLEKKAQRGEALPPGWQKKLVRGHRLEGHIFHHAVIVSPADRHGIATVRIEDRVLRLILATHEIVDILR